LLDAGPTLHHLDGQASRGIGLPGGEQDECSDRERRAEILGVWVPRIRFACKSAGRV
jgi:hypothetical protein